MYDFESDRLPDGERVTYKLLRWWLFDCYYQYCQNKINNKNRRGEDWLPNEREIAWAYEQNELASAPALERLMLEVLALILNAGREPATVEQYHRTKIATILAEHNLQDMLATLEGVELREFTYDLKLLGLL